MLKAGNKANASQPYRVSFAVRKPSPSPTPQTPKPTVVTTIAVINQRQDESLYKRPKVVKQEFCPVPGSLEVSLKRPALPLPPVTDKRAKIPTDLSTFPKPGNDDQLINSVSRDVETYLRLEGERTAIGELRKALGEGGGGEEEMVRLVDRAVAEVRRVRVGVAEASLSLLRLFSLKSEWSLLMTLSSLDDNSA